MISKEQFLENVDNLPEQIYSTKQKKEYTKLLREGNVWHGMRTSGSEFHLELDVLYQAYVENDFINTKTLLNGGYIKERKRSPAIALMAAAGLLDENGNTIK